ncbi:MAG: Hsp33 family molecular chaperone [Proteobacteria bacterium]|jgi:molecular chaperone Hsp33|nr:Hsp33 family molecular chaperone [Pseudomonadota bacterium]
MSAEPTELTVPSDDLVLPFQITNRNVRGRVIRLGSVVDEILGRHDYPDGVASLLARALTLAAMLGQSLKFDGKMTLQAKGDGAVTMIVADYATPGELRGWAKFDKDKYAAAVEQGLDPSREVPQLLGGGYLAFTVDQGRDTERYQGIVGLEGGTLAECAQKYFDDSEQIPTAVKLAVSHDDGWRAGGIMVQHLPPEGQPFGDKNNEDWREAAILMASVHDDELTSKALTADQLLFRLFHETGVRVFDETPLDVLCQCTRDRVEGILGQFPRESLEEMVVDGEIVMTCEFCNKDFKFNPVAAGVS